MTEQTLREYLVEATNGKVTDRNMEQYIGLPGYGAVNSLVSSLEYVADSLLELSEIPYSNKSFKEDFELFPQKYDEDVHGLIEDFYNAQGYDVTQNILGILGYNDQGAMVEVTISPCPRVKSYLVTAVGRSLDS